MGQTLLNYSSQSLGSDPINARERACRAGSDGPSLARSRGVLPLVACAATPFPGSYPLHELNVIPAKAEISQGLTRYRAWKAGIRRG
jgi:hypothetical protein